MQEVVECNQCFVYGIGCVGREGKTVVRMNGMEVSVIDGTISNCVVLRQEKNASHFIGAILARAKKQTPLSVDRQIDDLMAQAIFQT